MRSQLDVSQGRASVATDAVRKSPPDLHPPVTGNVGRCFGPDAWITDCTQIDVRAKFETVPEFPWGNGIWDEPCPFWKGRLIRDTHFAFLGVDSLRQHGHGPLTIRAWSAFYPNSFPATFPDNWWWPRQQFALTETCGFRWYLMPCSSVPSKNAATYDTQAANLPDNYEVPSAVEVVSLLVLHKKLTGSYPTSRGTWGRCRDLVSPRNFRSHALISTTTQELRFSYIGDDYTCLKELPRMYASRQIP